MVRYNIIDVPADGACLWHCLAWGNGQDAIEPLKTKIGNFIVRNADRPMNRSSITYRAAIATEFNLDAQSAPFVYVHRLGQKHIWGGAIDISAFVDMTQQPVRVYACGEMSNRLRMVQEFRPHRPKAGATTIRLLYGTNHFCLLEKVRSVQN